MLFITLDSSVIIAALRRQEENHSQCRSLLEKVKNAQYTSIQPYTVLVEVAAAVKRRTNSEHLAIQVKNLLQNMDTMNFVELSPVRADSAAELAAKTGLRGMDAVVVQIAHEFDATLITLDQEMMDRAKSIVKIRSVEKL